MFIWEILEYEIIFLESTHRIAVKPASTLPKIVNLIIYQYILGNIFENLIVPKVPNFIKIPVKSTEAEVGLSTCVFVNHW